MGPGGLDEQCALLQELFPRLSLHTLRQALKSGGSVEQAAEQLLVRLLGGVPAPAAAAACRPGCLPRAACLLTSCCTHRRPSSSKITICRLVRLPQPAQRPRAHR